jgi:di/tricarboxylate transporter
MAVALGTLLLTPLGHPVNVLVMGSGKVRQVGLLLTALLFIVVLVSLPLSWPLR